MKRLPLAVVDGIEAAPCVNSGFCCKQHPCPFGSIEPNGLWCKHLQEMEHDENTKRYTCAIADWIVEQPGWELAPAFGAGCSSTLFNRDREAVLRELGT